MLSLLLFQAADIKAFMFHIENNLICKVNAIVTIIFVDYVIAILMQFMAQLQ